MHGFMNVNMKLVWLTGSVGELNGTLNVSRHLHSLLSCIGASLFYLCDEYYCSTGSVCGPGSSVGTATGYGLDGPRIESR